MHLHVSLWQHGAAATTLEDNLEALCYQAHDLGIQITRSDDQNGKGVLLIEPDTWNVVFESFSAGTAPALLDAIKAGAKVILVCTEFPKPGGWNGSAKDDRQLANRWFWYKRVAPYVHAQWCFAAGAAQILRRFNPNSVDVDLGYSKTREQAFLSAVAKRPDWDQPTRDFGFFGGLTPRREQLLKSLRQTLGCDIHTLSAGERRSDGEVDWDSALKTDYVAPAIRNAEMLKCRVILHPSAFDYDPTSGKGWGIFSTSRAMTALHLMRPLVAEPTDPTVWQQIVEFSDKPGMIALSQAMNRVLKDWRGYRDRQLEAFREIMSPERTLGLAIERTIVRREAA